MNEPSGEKDPQSCDELKQAIDRTEPTDKSRQRLLIKKSVEMGCVEHIPDDWSIDG